MAKGRAKSPAHGAAGDARVSLLAALAGAAASLWHSHEPWGPPTLWLPPTVASVALCSFATLVGGRGPLAVAAIFLGRFLIYFGVETQVPFAEGRAVVRRVGSQPVVALLRALLYVLPFLLARRHVLRFRARRARHPTFAFPAAWVLREFLEHKLGLVHGTLGSVAYAAHDPVLLQPLEFGGLYALAFLVAALGFRLGTLAFYRRARYRDATKSAAKHAAGALLLLAACWLRLAAPSADPGGTLRVAGVAPVAHERLRRLVRGVALDGEAAAAAEVLECEAVDVGTLAEAASVAEAELGAALVDFQHVLEEKGATDGARVAAAAAAVSGKERDAGMARERALRARPGERICAALSVEELAFDYLASPDAYEQSLAAALDGAALHALAGADLVVWPELALLVPGGANETALLNVLAEVAADHRVFLLALYGALFHRRRLELAVRNSAVLLGGPQREILRASELRPRPTAARRFVREADAWLQVAFTAAGTLSASLGADALFADMGRAVAERTGGGGLHIVLQSERQRHGHRAAQAARFRGVEGGFNVVHFGGPGAALASTARGEIVASEMHGGGRRRAGAGPAAAPFAATVPTAGRRTFYARHGDWVVVACVAVLAFHAAR